MPHLLKLACIVPLALLLGCTAPITTALEQDDAALAVFYQRAEQALLNDGRLRTDTAPADAPFSERDLVENFVRIALYDEYTVRDGRYVERQSETHLRRWESPIRVATIFGESTPPQVQARDRAEVIAFTQRLSTISGVDMRVADEASANMLVLFLNRAEQREFAANLPQRYPGISQAVVDAFMNSPVNIFCAAFAFPVQGQKGVYGRSIILIKSEHGDLMRTSCIHEEMTQAMGLSNDSRTARPSIFNDDEEFALLTLHDELLLQMLYDPRLKAGMSVEQALPLLPEIAHDVAGGT